MLAPCHRVNVLAWTDERYKKKHVAQCKVCRSFDNGHSKKTLISHRVSNRPWAKVYVDLSTFNDSFYYFSGFWEIDPLENTKTKAVIRKMKTQFARYGAPDVCVSDDGPQFASEEYQKFSKSWKFQRVTSSPRYPQSNGHVKKRSPKCKMTNERSKTRSRRCILGTFSTFSSFCNVCIKSTCLEAPSVCMRQRCHKSRRF